MDYLRSPIKYKHKRFFPVVVDRWGGRLIFAMRAGLDSTRFCAKVDGVQSEVADGLRNGCCDLIIWFYGWWKGVGEGQLYLSGIYLG